MTITHTPCLNWPAAVRLAFRTGHAPVRVKGVWHVRGLA